MRYAVASQFDEGRRYFQGALTITPTNGGGLNITAEFVAEPARAFRLDSRAAASILATNLTDLCGALPGSARTWFVVELSATADEEYRPIREQLAAAVDASMRVSGRRRVDKGSQQKRNPVGDVVVTGGRQPLGDKVGLVDGGVKSTPVEHTSAFQRQQNDHCGGSSSHDGGARSVVVSHIKSPEQPHEPSHPGAMPHKGAGQ